MGCGKNNNKKNYNVMELTGNQSYCETNKIITFFKFRITFVINATTFHY